MLLVCCCFVQAAKLLRDVIKLAPSLAPPYYTLGLIYQELGDVAKVATFKFTPTSLINFFAPRQ